MTVPAGYSPRELRRGDAQALAHPCRANRTHLKDGEPPLPQAVMTTAIEIVVRVSLVNIALGPARFGCLGYWSGARHPRRGLAGAAVHQLLLHDDAPCPP